MTSSRIASRRAAALAAVIALAPAAPARADTSPADKAAAEALFEHARSLMKEGKYAEACPKLEESQRLDAGVGTMLNLAECYEKSGRTASAWAEFIDAAAAARAAGSQEREKRARDRAAALEPRLNKLVVTVEAEVPHLEVQRDGVTLQKPLWGTPVPLDPGEHTVVAAAPGKKAWTKTVRLDPSDLTPATIIVPALEDAPLPPPTSEPPKPLPVVPVAPDKAAVKPPTEGGLVVVAEGKPAPRAGALNSALPGAGQVVGYTLIGVGLAGAAVGGILGIVTLEHNSSASPYCRGVICNPVGVSDRNAALGTATGSNVALIAGGGVFATGVIVLLATRPPNAPDAGERRALRIEPVVGAGAGGISVRGSF